MGRYKCRTSTRKKTQTQPQKIRKTAGTQAAELLRNPAPRTIAAPSEARPMHNRTNTRGTAWVVVGNRRYDIHLKNKKATGRLSRGFRLSGKKTLPLLTSETTQKTPQSNSRSVPPPARHRNKLSPARLNKIDRQELNYRIISQGLPAASQPIVL